MISIETFYDPSVYWFLIGVALATLELVLPGMIVVFFGAGACTVSLVCLFANIGIEWELVAFSISSIMYLTLLRSRLKKNYFNVGELPKDFLADEIIGEHATVIESIAPDKTGTVQFRGTIWKATSFQAIEAGKEVTITDKKNITLVVTTINK